MDADLPHQMNSRAAESRWEVLKPFIKQLYLDEDREMKETIEIMKRDHNFDANENQYKYNFRKWKWKKNISAKNKTAIAAEMQSRASAGKLSNAVTYKGRAVDNKKIRRHIKDIKRKEIGLAQYGARAKDEARLSAVPMQGLSSGQLIFLRWNVPYHVFIRSRIISNHPSPHEYPAQTPGSDINVGTPSESATSPNNAPSPTMIVLQKNRAVERAFLFVQGKFDDLLKSLNNSERMTISDWLYQFWLFSFKTAKTWGRGPRHWTAETLGFGQRSPRNLLPDSPGANIADSPDNVRNAAVPAGLCRWLIHLPYDDESTRYDSYESEVETHSQHQDPLDEETWTPWPQSWENPPFQERLQDALEHNDFSTIPSEILPVAVQQIAGAARRSPVEVLEESLGFSIMGRNVDLVVKQMNQLHAHNADITGLYPLHLATSYLDGAKSCCDVLETLILHMKDTNPDQAKQLYVNQFGYTVLDNLMLTILKSHTSTSPYLLDPSMRSEIRFTGEEVDICGRWDADSDCIKDLYARGKTSIPFAWKHKFCHTSVQAICHCIAVLGNSRFSTFINHESGLWLRRCFRPSCGTKLQLYPAHALVITAFNLACFGCDDEDLFGIIVCLLYLRYLGLETRQEADISITAIFYGDNMHTDGPCDHESLTPLDLCYKLQILSSQVGKPWSRTKELGWQVLSLTLRLCADEADNVEAEDTEEARARVESESEDEFYHFPTEGFNHPDLHFDLHKWRLGQNTNLAKLSAIVLAEIATYRRVADGDPWMSNYVSMDTILKALESGDLSTVNYVREGLLKPYCICGLFENYYYELRPTVKEVTTRHIANCDIWGRATFSIFPEQRW